MNEKKALSIVEIFKLLKQKRKTAQDKRKEPVKKSFRQTVLTTGKK